MPKTSDNADAAARKMYQDYVTRWKLVNEFQNEETRRLTPTQRYRQFLAFVALAKRMKWRTSTSAEDAEAARRWRRFRRASRG